MLFSLKAGVTRDSRVTPGFKNWALVSFSWRSFLHEFGYFLCQDLGSSNILELCASLMTSCHMVDAEIIPALFPSVIEKLSHPK